MNNPAYLICPKCSKELRLTKFKAIFGKKYEIWSCTHCWYSTRIKAEPKPKQ